MEGPEVPSFFICPISLQIMKDPVTISTGMTYDRDSIQKWLFCYNHKTCPVTKQALTNHILTPNSTLLRLIESWINNNPSRSPSMIHPPKPWPDISILLGKLSKEVREPELQIKSLRKIKSLIQESDHNRLFMEDTGIASLVASLITETDPQAMSQFSENSVLIEEATTVLYLLKPSLETLKKLCQDRKGLLITSLSLIIQRCYQARIHAALLLRSIFRAVDDSYKAELRMELFEGVAEILKDHNSNRATMAVLLILIEVMPLGRNRIKAVDAGIVSVLVELIAESSEKRSCEIMLGILEQLCGRAEGRSAFLAHPASVAAVATKILRISHFANDKAVNVILSVCRFCKSSGVTKELLEVGGVAKLCMVVQSDCNMKTKERAKEILGLHLKEWKKSPCFPSYFIA